jgi:hypothetical protein
MGSGGRTRIETRRRSVKARHLISMHNGMTVRCDGEEWALDFAQELRMIDATLKMAGIDTARVSSRRMSSHPS